MLSDLSVLLFLGNVLIQSIALCSSKKVLVGVSDVRTVFRTVHICPMTHARLPTNSLEFLDSFVSVRYIE